MLARRSRRCAAPAHPAAPPPARLDPAEAQAFSEHARWLHDYHEKRSDRLGQRAATLLGFAGVVAALLPAGFTLGKDDIDFTLWVRTVVVALVLLVLSAGCSLKTIAVRKATVQDVEQLRRQWHKYATGSGRGLVHAQIAHSYLGGESDPISDASDEADERATWCRPGPPAGTT